MTPVQPVRPWEESPNDPWWMARLRSRRKGARMGRVFHHRSSATSSNDLAREWLDEGGPDGLVVLVDEQTAGRGRRGRSWSSPRGMGLYFSVGLRPRFGGDRTSWLTFLGAVAVAEALRSRGVAVDIRWPNDLDVDGRKVGGLLVETRVDGNEVASAVLGIGLNLTQGVSDFPPEFQGRATSLRLVMGDVPESDELLDAVLDHLEAWYGQLRSETDLESGGRALLQRWRELAPGHQGHRVEVDEDGETFHGVTCGIESDGALRVRRPDGRQVLVRAGEVRRVRPFAGPDVPKRR
jgi:BirA family transcriptional regulator, biotin operon repressor / biotin---[acetyl-CoA-carboxylase] ligase